jgi:hypothetical protein
MTTDIQICDHKLMAVMKKRLREEKKHEKMVKAMIDDSFKRLGSYKQFPIMSLGDMFEACRSISRQEGYCTIEAIDNEMTKQIAKFEVKQ